MKVITIKEPFASLIKEKRKRIETRSWKTNYRGKIYIHASKSKVNLDDKRLFALTKLLKNTNFKYGNIICEAKLIDCIYMDNSFISSLNPIEMLCGHYEVGRYAWVLDNIKVVEPIEAKGQLGIWNYKD